MSKHVTDTLIIRVTVHRSEETKQPTLAPIEAAIEGAIAARYAANAELAGQPTDELEVNATAEWTDN